MIVSITSAASDRARLPPSAHCRAILRLVFSDVDRSDAGDLFSREQACDIWDLIAAHQSEIACIVLHCDAGISRSPGVAAAISKALLDDDAEFFRRYRPNMHVYRTMLETFHDAYAGRFAAPSPSNTR